MSRSGQMTRTFTARGLPRYEVEVRHDELHKYQVIRGDDANIVRQKATAKMAEWDAMWARRAASAARTKSLNDKGEEAAERTRATTSALADLDSLLAFTLNIDDAIKWDALKSTAPFPTPAPASPIPPSAPRELTLPLAPVRTDPKYAPRLGLFDRLSKTRRAARHAEAASRYADDIKAWELAKTTAQANHLKAKEEHARQVQVLQASYDASLAAWSTERDAYLAQQAAANDAVEAKRAKYLARDREAIVDYCDLVLSNSLYPDTFPKTFDLDYNSETGVLIVDYALPAPEALPTVEEVRYVKNKDEFVEKILSRAQQEKLYDRVVYQICLRSQHELFEADTVDALSAIVLNGYVHSVDPASGNEVDACILTVQAGKAEFLQINLANVDPKACFKKLRGVGSSKLHSLTPVAPLLQMSREDARFVAGRAVVEGLETGANLAVMDWEEFEHLIREMFEKEFAAAGGEVRVTRATRDGGIDAVVFDPDPIRGGKIVIQAKRYTHTVSVSAVRDLYGAVMNEGANKGILVTTADYGPDAYEFVRGKPLVLLNGGNLLHMLGKHGVRARIDLKEARGEDVST